MNNRSKYRCIAMRNWRYYDELMLHGTEDITLSNISICLTLKKNKDIRSN